MSRPGELQLIWLWTMFFICFYMLIEEQVRASAYPNSIHSVRRMERLSSCRGWLDVASGELNAADSTQPVFDSTRLGFGAGSADSEVLKDSRM